MTETHLHFIVWAAMQRSPDGGYVDVVYVDVMAESEQAALVRAEVLCPGRAFYRVNNIIEHHADHGGQSHAEHSG